MFLMLAGGAMCLFELPMPQLEPVRCQFVALKPPTYHSSVLLCPREALGAKSVSGRMWAHPCMFPASPEAPLPCIAPPTSWVVAMSQGDPWGPLGRVTWVLGCSVCVRKWVCYSCMWACSPLWVSRGGGGGGGLPWRTSGGPLGHSQGKESGTRQGG
jgi:hypothetical protein